MLVVRVTENVRAVQSSYYSSCPCPTMTLNANETAQLVDDGLKQNHVVFP
jgi:hypothetical protein